MSVQIESPRLQLCNASIARIADQSLEYRARISNDDAKTNIWCKDKQQRPPMAMFLLSHEFFYVIEDFDQAFWFNRTEDRDFSVDNTVGVGANDPQGRRQLARYMIRNPFSLKKMEYQAQQGMVVYRSRHHVDTRLVLFY